MTNITKGNTRLILPTNIAMMGNASLRCLSHLQHSVVRSWFK